MENNTIGVYLIRNAYQSALWHEGESKKKSFVNEFMVLKYAGGFNPCESAIKCLKKNYTKAFVAALVTLNAGWLALVSMIGSIAVGFHLESRWPFLAAVIFPLTLMFAWNKAEKFAKEYLSHDNYTLFEERKLRWEVEGLLRDYPEIKTISDVVVVINRLVFEKVCLEMNLSAAPLVTPKLKEQSSSLDYKIRNVADFSKKFCISDGNLKPPFQTAEEQWLKFAGEGRMMVDFQI